MTEKGSILPEITKLPHEFFSSLGIKQEVAHKLINSIFNPDENGFDELLYSGLGANEKTVRNYIEDVRRLYSDQRAMVEDLYDKGFIKKQ